MLVSTPELPHTPLPTPTPTADTACPLTPLTAVTPCRPAGMQPTAASTPTAHHSPRGPRSVSTPSSPAGSQQQLAAATLDTDSGKSSCSPALLDCSFDSGIGVDAHDPQLQQRIEQCRRILTALERDKERYRKLRERLSKLVDKRSKHVKDEEELPHSCNICCTPIDAAEVKTFVRCCTCNKHICRGIKCANWLPKTAEWECQLCHSSKESLALTSSWVAEQMSFNQQKFVYPLRARSEVYIPITDCNDSSMHFESVSQIDGNNAAIITAEQKVKIREYVEELVANMLGGSLDSIRVGQMSKSENYLPAIVNGRSAASAQPNGSNEPSANEQQSFAGISQMRLRQLIEAIIAETLHQPALSPSAAVSEVALDTHGSNGVGVEGAADGSPLATPVRRHRTEHYFEPKIYQDLLATAVLNKIADQQGHPNGRLLSESTPDLSGRIVDPTYHVERHSSSSGSSVVPRSECSYTDTEQILNQIGKGENDISPCDSQQNLHVVDTPLRLAAGRESALSDYIATHMVPLPDLSAPTTESEEEEDYLSVTSSTLGDRTWEDNWLFKKKRGANLKTAVTAGSVGMLVPAPKEDVRAQIGDKTTDEVSDLSEMGSDTDESSLDLLRNNEMDPLNDRLLNKHLIGGQNTKMVLDELIERASMISHTSLAENEPVYTETKNEEVLNNAAAQAEAINTSVAPPSPATSELEPPQLPKTAAPTMQEYMELQEAGTPNPLAGSIAEREYKKWNNAVEMPNNPYAPEALKKRISGSMERFIDLPNISPSSETNPVTLEQDTQAQEASREVEAKRYSRDYYVNELNEVKQNGRRPVGVEAHTPTSNGHSQTNSDEPATEDIVINEAEKAKAATESQPQPPTQSPAATQNPSSDVVYQALPAQILAVHAPSSIETEFSNQSLQSVQSVQTSSSDDSDTVRIYNFKKQETTKVRDSSKKIDAMRARGMSVDAAATTSEPGTGRKERPKDLPLKRAASADAVRASSPVKANRGTTPTALRFLQPKRKLIEPSQVLLCNDESRTDAPHATPEKAVIEQEVVQALPSVRALATMFLQQKNANPKEERSWRVKTKLTPESLKHFTPIVPHRNFETSPTVATNSSANSSVSVSQQIIFNNNLHIATKVNSANSSNTTPRHSPPTTPLPTPTTPTAPITPTGKMSPIPMLPSGFLKSNIAFFENLKTK